MPDTTGPDETTINFTDTAGDGPPVLLIHGITESSAAWEPIIEPLAPSHRVIAMDLRGHGRSAKANRYDLEVRAGDVIYEAWLSDFIANAEVEVWPEHGHHPHLVDPDHFVERLHAFWGANGQAG